MDSSQHTPLISLRHLRLNRGLSIRQAALDVGVAQETFRRLESGETVYPASAKKVADYFGVQVTDLMSVDEPAAA